MDGGNAFGGSEPERLAQKAADAGFGHISAQWDYVPQRPLVLRLRDECHALGLTCGVWESEPQPGSGAEAVLESGADHYIAQAETQRDWPTIVSTFRHAYPKLPAAVVTTFGGIGALEGGGYDRSLSRPVIDAGFRCLTEAYPNANLPSTPDNMTWTATAQLGWPAAQATIGVWGGYPFQRYVDSWNLQAHPGYWVWLAETMTPQDWSDAHAFNLA